MDIKTLQRALTSLQMYKGPINGTIDGNTMQAIQAILTQELRTDWQAWARDRQIVAAKQIVLHEMGIEVGAVDGLVGPQMRLAIEKWQDMMREVAGDSWDVTAPKMNDWPTQKQVPSFYGAVGTNQVTLQLPYPMRLAWDLNSNVTKFSCHAKVHDSAHRVFTRVLKEYGIDEIKRLRLDYFGGCLNVRKMRGGSSWSMHAWGIAIDIDPEHNALRMDRSQATLASPEYDKWWAAWEDEGWLSLGRARDYDWMHLQAARL